MGRRYDTKSVLHNFPIPASQVYGLVIGACRLSAIDAGAPCLPPDPTNEQLEAGSGSMVPQTYTTESKKHKDDESQKTHKPFLKPGAPRPLR
jgi:hypothetical protein